MTDPLIASLQRQLTSTLADLAKEKLSTAYLTARLEEFQLRHDRTLADLLKETRISYNLKLENDAMKLKLDHLFGEDSELRPLTRDLLRNICAEIDRLTAERDGLKSKVESLMQWINTSGLGPNQQVVYGSGRSMVVDRA